ncbi:hypothetical protein [Sulfitobacter geojensis]|uniref:hypothetical protein n=1 Tax=Sulfitobacter geojensis TaxID=1342299 RepID=UPI003B8AA58D
MSGRFKTRAIKANKTYEVGELADTACVSIPTVRNWLKAGMQKVDDQRPTVIMGFQALEFLNHRKANAKRPMVIGQFYCMRCKDRRASLGAMADYEPTSATGGRLKAFCAVCECPCNLNVRACDLPEICKVLDVEIRVSR